MNIRTGAVRLAGHVPIDACVAQRPFNPVCLTSAGDPVLDPTIVNPAACAAAGYQPNPNVDIGLIPFDLTRGGLSHTHVNIWLNYTL